MYCPPQNVYKELRDDCGCAIPNHGNLEKWASQARAAGCGYSFFLSLQSGLCSDLGHRWALSRRGMQRALRAHLCCLCNCLRKHNLAALSFSWPQGVLLLNAVLTVRAHDAASHSKRGWETFTDAAISQLAKRTSGVVFLLWGKFAQVGAGRCGDAAATDVSRLLPASLQPQCSAVRFGWLSHQVACHTWPRNAIGDCSLLSYCPAGR